MIIIVITLEHLLLHVSAYVFVPVVYISNHKIIIVLLMVISIHYLPFFYFSNYELQLMKLLNVIVVIDTPYDLKDAAELKVSFIIIILIILACT